MLISLLLLREAALADLLERQLACLGQAPVALGEREVAARVLGQLGRFAG
jgi:hypothetical protein